MYKHFNIQFLYHLISSWFLSPLLLLRLRSIVCLTPSAAEQQSRIDFIIDLITIERLDSCGCGKYAGEEKANGIENKHTSVTPLHTRSARLERISFSLHLGSTRGDDAHIHSAHRVMSKRCWYQKSTGDGSASACFRLTSSPRLSLTLLMPGVEMELNVHTWLFHIFCTSFEEYAFFDLFSVSRWDTYKSKHGHNKLRNENENTHKMYITLKLTLTVLSASHFRYFIMKYDVNESRE